jgi:hypothetical protein
MTDSVLIKEKEELKLRLTGGKYKTLIDVILDRVSRVVQKLTHSSYLVSFWYSAAAFCLFLLLIGAVISILFGEYHFIREKIVYIVIIGALLAYASLVIFKIFINRVFANLGDHIVEVITSEADLEDLQRWLGWLCNIRIHLAFSLIYGLIMGIYTANALSVTNQGSIGYGLSIVACLVGFVWGIPMYFLFIFLFLPSRLSQYNYRLYKNNPASSEVIAHLSDLMSGLVLLYAIVAGGSMIFLAYAELLNSETMIWITIIVSWIPITFLFISGQYALKKIIRRMKWLTLNEIQSQIERIQVEENLAEKETMEKINRLMDYHDRIRATRNSTLDFGVGLNFLNSLLLPVIGFVVGNQDFLRNVIKDIKNMLNRL